MTVAVLRVRDDVIVMQTMLWPDEVRSPELANLGDADSAAKPAELKMANMLVESLAGDYDPGDYEDDYEQAVEAVVRAKLEGGEVQEVAGPAEEGAGEVVDLLAALQRSVERAKAARGEPTGKDAAGNDEAGDEGPGDEGPGGEPQEDKAPAGRAPARKTAAKKATPAKKTAPRKSAPARKATKKSASADDAPRKKAAS
jgi:DNA end-binding protein Ku